MLENHLQMTADEQHRAETFGALPTLPPSPAQRGTRYGAFPGHARITQNPNARWDSLNWGLLTTNSAEALEMVAHKIGRIPNGDPNYHDPGHDIMATSHRRTGRITVRFELSGPGPSGMTS